MSSACLPPSLSSHLRHSTIALFCMGWDWSPPPQRPTSESSRSLHAIARESRIYHLNGGGGHIQRTAPASAHTLAYIGAIIEACHQCWSLSGQWAFGERQNFGSLYELLTPSTRSVRMSVVKAHFPGACMHHIRIDSGPSSHHHSRGSFYDIPRCPLSLGSEG